MRSNCQHLLDHSKSNRVPEKTSTSVLLIVPKWNTTNYVAHNKLWKILQETGITDHFTCLLRNLYADQEATVRTRHGMMDWFPTGKGVRQGCILSPCLFTLYAAYIMWNARLNVAQAGIKIVGRNINNLRYADDTILMGVKSKLGGGLALRWYKV